MTNLIIERHGESEANFKNIYAGTYDARLTEKGKAQASAAAKYVYENYKLDAIYSSDIQRAVDTAKYVSELFSLDIRKDTGLREMFGGKWEGKTFDELESTYPIEFGIWKNDIGHTQCPDGENPKNVQVRVMASLERIAKENDGKTVLVVSHGMAIRTMVCAICKIPLEKMQDTPWFNNASISEIKFENGVFSPIFWGKCDYLS